MDDKSVTHLLFVDSDIGFGPEAVTRMVASCFPVVGCICPARAVDPVRMQAAARDVNDPLVAQEIGHTYISSECLVCEPQASGGTAVRIKAGFARISQIGMGLTLIRREVLEQMAERRPDLFTEDDGWYKASKLSGRVFQAFDRERSAAGMVVGEDYSFCQRWTQDCCGEIWALIDEPISHAGLSFFRGTFEKRLHYEAWLEGRRIHQEQSGGTGPPVP